MAEKVKVEARNIHVQVFSKPTAVRNGSGAYVSSVQVVKSSELAHDVKVRDNKPAAKKAAAKSKASRKATAGAKGKKKVKS